MGHSICSTPAPAAASVWQIDPKHSAAQFSVRHLAISTVRGGFSNVKGTVTLDDQEGHHRVQRRPSPSMSQPSIRVYLTATKT